MRLLATLLVFLLTAVSSAEDSGYRILAWNIESDGSDPAVIREQLAKLESYDVVALSETPATQVENLARAVGANHKWIMGQTGHNDRLMIIYDGDRFELVRQLELSRGGDIALNDGNHRSPLVAHLRDRTSGLEFLVMNNHLARRNAELREQQARGLVAWARDQTLPVIAVGDYNFDFAFTTQSGNEAFRAFLAAGVWTWIKPDPLVDTNWADNNLDGRDDYPDSMLDFVFVAGRAKEWRVTSRVIVREGDFPDDARTSDHRPVEVTIPPLR